MVLPIRRVLLEVTKQQNEFGKPWTSVYPLLVWCVQVRLVEE